VLDPQSKLATARSWNHSTLGERFGVADAGENALSAALDWLLNQHRAALAPPQSRFERLTNESPRLCRGIVTFR
jgi:hypothetical protein